MMRVCLVRHGQTDWNVEGRYQGQSDVPLNAIGRLQAQALAEKLASEPGSRPFEALYASDLLRARQTAAALGEALDLPVRLDSRLREIAQGAWEGQLIQQIQQRGDWQQQRAGPAEFRPPGGETLVEVAARMKAALDEMAARHPGQCVLVVTHGLALATALCRAQGLPLAQAFRLIPDNAVQSWLDWPPAAD